MSKYTLRTTIPRYWQRMLAEYCQSYSEIKKDLRSDDEKRRVQARKGIDAIDTCIKLIGMRDDLSGTTVQALYANVCCGVSYEKMKDKPPCGKNQFYNLRKEFFELLYERMVLG